MTQSATLPKTAVITGATRGLGLHAAETIAATDGWTPVLAVRDLAAGRDVAARTAGAVVELDLADLDSVRRAAARLVAGHTPIDALVLNAGLQVTRADRATADGFELTFGVNHLGHFLLTRLLVDAGALAPARGSSWWRAERTSARFARPGASRPALARPARPRAPRRRLGPGRVLDVQARQRPVRARGVARLPDLTVDVFDPGLMPDTGLARDYPARARACTRGSRR
jgi:protochlorophyllide reductase